MVVRELIAKLGLKIDKGSFQKADSGISKIKGAVARLAAGLAAGLAVKRIKDITEETARLGDQIAKTSEKLGVGAAALQELRHAAELTGIPTRTMDMALQRFTRRAAEAAKGTGEAKDALKQMGVRLKDSQGQLRPTEELLGDVADAMAKTKGDGDRLRLAFKLFDSEGAALVNTLKGGKAALEEMRQEARDLGGIMDDELIALSVEYTDESLRATKALRGVKNMIARNLLPVLIKGKQGIVEWIKVNREWLRSNITGAIDKTVRVVSALARGIRVIVIGLREAWRNADPVTKALLKMSAAAAVLAVILTSPILTLLAIGLAVGLVLEDFERWQTGGVSVIGALDKKLGGFLSAIRDGETDLFNLGVAWDWWTDRGIEALNVVGEAIGVAVKWWGQQFKWLFWDLPVKTVDRFLKWFIAKLEGTKVGQTIARLAGAAGSIAGGGGVGEAIDVLRGKGKTAFAAAGNVAGNLQGQVATAPVGSVSKGAGAPSITMAPTTNLAIHNAQNLDETQLADKVGQRIGEENDRMLRNAAAAYSTAPEPVGG